MQGVASWVYGAWHAPKQQAEQLRSRKEEGSLGGRMESRLQSAWLCEGSEGWSIQDAKIAKESFNGGVFEGSKDAD